MAQYAFVAIEMQTVQISAFLCANTLHLEKFAQALK